MKNTALREDRYHKLYRSCTLIYQFICIAMIVFYAVRRDVYHLSISIATPLVPLGIHLFYRLFRLRPVRQIDLMALGFIFLAWPLGSCIDLYRTLPGFDKITHCLSGVFVSVLCIILFYFCKPGRRIGAEDRALLLMFVFFGSMAVAGLWEVGEYFVHLLTGIDVQRVASTGVADSMQDILVCLVGTAAALPIASSLCRGRRNLMTSGVADFIEINLQNRKPLSDGNSTHPHPSSDPHRDA